LGGKLRAKIILRVSGAAGKDERDGKQGGKANRASQQHRNHLAKRVLKREKTAAAQVRKRLQGRCFSSLVLLSYTATESAARRRSGYLIRGIVSPTPVEPPSRVLHLTWRSGKDCDRERHRVPTGLARAAELGLGARRVEPAVLLGVLDVLAFGEPKVLDHGVERFQHDPFELGERPAA
jgi:hypothetical protein